MVSPTGKRIAELTSAIGLPFFGMRLPLEGKNLFLGLYLVLVPWLMLLTHAALWGADSIIAGLTRGIWLGLNRCRFKPSYSPQIQVDK
jgi:hypothetical protein